ncbi:MAG: aspartate carbamoyltransferase catalytic subunit [Phycisphaeraceae bacterium]|nr:aspartate carbamoyltransferase catalytic subunit [Phycisphaeraceae bacterium]
MTTTLARPHGTRGSCLLRLRAMPLPEMRALLSRARDHLEAIESGTPDGAWLSSLRGVVVANLFFEDSTRTRMSFTLAARRLGAEVLDLAAGSSSLKKGETLLDTARVVEAMGAHALVIRHEHSGACDTVARAVRCAVLNAGDGRHEHPTQGLLDALALARARGRDADFDLSGLRVAILGDVLNSRVARSDIAAFTALGASVVCVGPPAFAPASLKGMGVEVAHDLDAVLPTVDAVQTLRIQFERSATIASARDYARGYQLTTARATKLKRGAIVMHPGPVNRGVELAPDVADDPTRSVILNQVAAGVAVRMAALERCVGG